MSSPSPNSSNTSSSNTNSSNQPKAPGALANRTVAIIGGGPAGLMAAEVLVEAGLKVDVYEAMPTLGRKFLRAGLGGLNITHSEPYKDFCTRYGESQQAMQAFIDHFPPERLRDWVHDLGIETFVGSSGRVFPKEMKAAPLLRTWVHRLKKAGVNFYHNHLWTGYTDDKSLKLDAPGGAITIKPDAVVLALGGASWPQLGSTGTWTPWLQEQGIKIAPWQPANCGFDVEWSDLLKQKFDHTPLKSVAITFKDTNGKTETRQGELLICDYGVEGSLIYAFSKGLRQTISLHGQATFTLDLLPGRTADKVLSDLSRPRKSRTMTRHLQSCLGDNALKRNLLYEVLSRQQMEDARTLTKFIKALPITVKATRPIAEAISTAGGVCFDALDQNLMLKVLPGTFVAGEMIDWEAPTGGYLLTGCFATGKQAGQGVINWLLCSEKNH